MTPKEKVRAKSEYLYAIAVAVLLISIQQLVILEIQVYDEYRIAEGITADILLCLMCATILLLIPYRVIQLKTIWIAYSVWFFLSFIHNTITQLFFPDSSAHVVEIFGFSLLFALLFVFRFALAWINPAADMPRDGMFYEIIGWPRDSAQYALAAKTGQGGTYAITDNKKLWLCSNETNSKIEIDLPREFLRGHMCLPICAVFNDGYKQLKLMNNEPYDLVHNCEDYHKLAKKWRGSWWSKFKGSLK